MTFAVQVTNLERQSSISLFNWKYQIKIGYGCLIIACRFRTHWHLSQKPCPFISTTYVLCILHKNFFRRLGLYLQPLLPLYMQALVGKASEEVLGLCFSDVVDTPFSSSERKNHGPCLTITTVLTVVRRTLHLSSCVLGSHMRPRGRRACILHLGCVLQADAHPQAPMTTSFVNLTTR